jgi:hypothetical protein
MAHNGLLTRLTNENQELLARVKELEIEKQNVTMEVEKTEAATSNLTFAHKLMRTTTNLTNNEKIMQQKQIQTVNTLSSELQERDRRKKNVVVFGLAESKKGSHDEERTKGRSSSD